MHAPLVSPPVLDPAGSAEPLEQVLATLTRYGPSADNDGWLSSVELSRLLRDNHSLRVHWRTLDALLAHDKSLAARRKRNSRWEYKVLAAGRGRVTAASRGFLLIEPDKAMQAVRSVHSIMEALEGEVCLCDPYFDHVSIEHLSAVPAAVPVRILTVNIQEQPRVKRLLAAAGTEGRTMQVRVATQGKLHDRYLIDRVGLFILGGSLNGLGKKQSMLIRGGDDIRKSLLDTFNVNWATAAPWP